MRLAEITKNDPSVGSILKSLLEKLEVQIKKTDKERAEAEWIQEDHEILQDRYEEITNIIHNHYHSMQLWNLADGKIDEISRMTNALLIELNEKIDDIDRERRQVEGIHDDHEILQDGYFDIKHIHSEYAKELKDLFIRRLAGK